MHTDIVTGIHCSFPSLGLPGLRHMNERNEPILGSALQEYAAAELVSAMAGLSQPGGRLHAGVHRARKALRRARATLALGGSTLGPGGTLLDRELRGLNLGLSVLRDRHALVETLDRLLDGGHAPPTLQLLRRARRIAAAARAGAAREARQPDSALSRALALLPVIAAALPALPWPQLRAEGVGAAVELSQDAMRRAGERAQRRGKDEDWHRWRRRARRLSQQRRALKTAGWSVDTPAFDRDVTDLLGVAQDLNLLYDQCGRDSPFSDADRRRLRRFARSELDGLRDRIAPARREPRSPPSPGFSESVSSGPPPSPA